MCKPLQSSFLSPEAENRRLRERLDEWEREARNNEEVFRRFREREQELLDADGLPQLLEILTDGMQVSFKVCAVSLVLQDGNHELRRLLDAGGRPAATFDRVRFVDDLESFHPLYCRLNRPLLGPYQADEHQSLFPGGCPPLGSVALVPLMLRGQPVGSLNLGSRDATRFTRHHSTDFLSRLAMIAAVCLENTAVRQHLVFSGITDALTGLHNRRYLERRLQEEIARARRHGQPLSCLFVDADHFKRVNDEHGHNTGDLVLREIARRMRECLRRSDVATRFGGEEFALLLPQTDADEAFCLAERIRRHIGGQPFPTAQGGRIPVTVSIGVGELPGEGGDGAGKRMLEQADAALYQAKRQGRDRVVRADRPA
ncbi:MAG TPA: sensor domain-containing diguanylate cyclase [Sedimenticola thiotaurini]|uniref:diguanylate cyclase n=1 Tax=Sedimenticola thiotaurini TaxID=1543721 RepID=A0A831RK32_9GAMM|nr:sensor domain-containing diguanylate cyclase [Sedimenticola thiotaurini]